MASKKITKQNLVFYIQEHLKKLILEEKNKNTKEKSEYSEKAKEFISNKMKKMSDEDKPQDQKIAIAMNMARKKGMKVPSKKNK